MQWHFAYLMKKQKVKYLFFTSRPVRDRENVCGNVEKCPSGGVSHALLGFYTKA